MKKWIFKGFIVIIFCFWSFSNPLFSSDITSHLGIKMGYGFTSASVENHSSSSDGFFSKDSLAGGIFVHFSHVDFAGIQIEALYIQKGFQRSTYQAELEYLSFPILARFQIPSVGIFFNLGFGITWLFDGSVSDSTSTLTGLDNYFDRLEYDLQGGLGWDIEIFKGLKTLLELRFTYTLSNISTRYPEELNQYTAHLYIGFETDFEFSSSPESKEKRDEKTVPIDKQGLSLLDFQY